MERAMPFCYESEHIWEYAKLSQYLYLINYNDLNILPQNWKSISMPQSHRIWDTIYGLFQNPIKKEIVLVMNGTDPQTTLHLLKDASTVEFALSGKSERSPFIKDFVSSQQKDNAPASLKDDLAYFWHKTDEYDRFVGYTLYGYQLGLLYTVAGLGGLLPKEVPFAFPGLLTPAYTDLEPLGSVAVNEKFYERSLSNLRKSLEKVSAQKSENEFHAVLLKLIATHFTNFKLKIVGYSLGALNAEICSVKLGVECISFESSGSLNILNTLEDCRDKGHSIINFLSAPNVFNTLNEHSGTVYRMRLPHSGLPDFTEHRINCSLNILSSFLIALGAASIPVAAIGTVSSGVILICTGICLKMRQLVEPDIWKIKEWLLNQHNIYPITTYLRQCFFTITTEQYRCENNCIEEMRSWPKLYLQGEHINTGELIRRFLPFQADQPGLRNLYDEEVMREGQVQRMVGYLKKR